MSEASCECVVLFGRDIGRDEPVPLRLLRRCKFCRDERKATYLKRIDRLNSLNGTGLLKEIFGADKESILKEVAEGKVDRNPGRQNKRKGTAWRVRHRMAKQSRQRNRRGARNG